MNLCLMFTWPARRGTGPRAALLIAAQAHARTLGSSYLTVGTISKTMQSKVSMPSRDHANITQNALTPRYRLRPQAASARIKIWLTKM